MRITTRFLDETGNTVFRYQSTTSSAVLFAQARAHAPRYRKQGVNWALNLLSERGAQFVSTIQAGNWQHEVEQAAVDLAVSAFLIDTLFGGIAPPEFACGDLLVTILDDHTTTFQRIRPALTEPDIESLYRSSEQV